MVARRAQEGMDVSRSALAVSWLPGTAYECAPAPPDRSPCSQACQHYRTAALGGHVERCQACAHLRISYNSLYGDLYVKLSVGTTRGEPAHWARSIAPRPCIRLDPCWTRTMKQSFASTARLRAAGPF